jgi:hypothetical protein
MQHGISTKYHLVDSGWDYGEFRWLSHHYSKRGLISGKRRKSIRYYKNQFARAERRRGKREVQSQDTDRYENSC